LKKLVSIFILSFVGFFSFAQEDLTRILFILDASNSMNLKWGRESKLTVAKDILTRTVDSLTGVPNLEIGLRVYGHQSPITATYQDCKDTKLEVPFGQNNVERIKSKLNSIQAKGTTPIARSLEAAAGDFPDRQSKNIIILITDGVEACDDEPCVIADKLRAKGITISPFVIGLGMEMKYLEKFDCIGQYKNAEDRNSFSAVLKTVVDKALVNTTVQVNLNTINKKPLETNTTLFFYEAGTDKLIYTFMHTLNEKGLPDTLIIDPNKKYDLVVNTLPRKYKKNISIKKYQHNTIEVDAPQGSLTLKIRNKAEPHLINYRVWQDGKLVTLNRQFLEEQQRYIVGKYKIEVLTLPRIYFDIEIKQSENEVLSIESPGYVRLKSPTAVVGQIFVKNQDESLSWVCDLAENSTQHKWLLQPGNYQVVYREKDAIATNYTKKQDFRITSNRTITLNL